MCGYRGAVATPREALLEQLRAAFPRTPIPEQPPGAYGWTYLDVPEVRALVEGKSWEDIDRVGLARRDDVMGFLGPELFAALLPAYLLAFIDARDGENPTGMLTQCLAKPDKSAGRGMGLGRPRFRALVAALTPAQRCAVAEALLLHAETHPDSDDDTRRALLYWAAYLPRPR